MKVVFMGAPSFAVPSLEALAKTGAEIVAVYTKAPKSAGRRGLELSKTPVHVLAERLGFRVETPETLRGPEAAESLQAFSPDLAIVAAYGLLLPQAILSIPRLGCYNLHGSLLPRWRGAAPVQRAIMSGDAETGVALMRMEKGLDTGDFAGEVRTAIGRTETAGDLTARLADLAASTLRDNWPALASQTLTFARQAEAGLTYARKIEKDEAPIDWRQSAAEVKAHINGLSPFPGATATLGAGAQRLKLLRADLADAGGRPGEILDRQFTVACGEGAVRVLEAQRPGRNVVTGEEFLRAGLLKIGETFAI